jgi:tellurite methyltransferase
LRSLDRAAALGWRAGHAVLDVREEEAFRAGHLAGSGNVPRREFRARRAELPPREAPLLVVAASGAHAETAAAELETLGFTGVAWLDAPIESLPDALADRGPAVRLWRPAPFLEEMLPRLEIPRGTHPVALDVAAGAGREAVYLALNGFEVEARDRDPEALSRARSLAERHGVRLDTIVTDLERGEVSMPPSRYALVVCFRYLHRPLLPQLEGALAPGGHLIYETYRTGQEKYGKPVRARFLLRPGELASAFPTLEILYYAELEPAGGPVTARLLARRPETQGPRP